MQIASLKTAIHLVVSAKGSIISRTKGQGVLTRFCTSCGGRFTAQFRTEYYSERLSALGMQLEQFEFFSHILRILQKHFTGRDVHDVHFRVLLFIKRFLVHRLCNTTNDQV